MTWNPIKDLTMKAIYNYLRNNIFFYLIMISSIMLFITTYYLKNDMSVSDKIISLACFFIIVTMFSHSVYEKVIMPLSSNGFTLGLIGAAFVCSSIFSIIEGFRLNNDFFFMFFNFINMFNFCVIFLVIPIIPLYITDFMKLKREKTFILLKSWMKVSVISTMDCVSTSYRVSGYKFDDEGWHVDNKIISYHDIYRFMHDIGKSHLEKDDFKLMEMYFFS